MADGAKARRRAKVDADAIRAAGEADAARRLECAEAERRAVLADATHRASEILREAEMNAADEAARLRDDAHQDAKRIREDAVEEVLKLMSTLTTERDHILADAHDDARRIIDAAREEHDAHRRELERSAAGTQADPTPESCPVPDHVVSRSELDELFFPGAPEGAPLESPRPQLRHRRRKRFLRRR
jgi:F0F1-type ATP synthase membrane subunit b/b'